MLDYIPNLITEEENNDLIRPPNDKEVKEAVFSFNGGSVTGLDGFLGAFLQNCWDIIG